MLDQGAYSTASAAMLMSTPESPSFLAFQLAAPSGPARTVKLVRGNLNFLDFVPLHSLRPTSRSTYGGERQLCPALLCTCDCGQARHLRVTCQRPMAGVAPSHFRHL